MIAKAPPTLYEALYPHLNIDADVCDPEYYKHLPLTPNHATSNPRFIHQQFVNPANAEMVETAVKEMPGASVEEVYSVLVCHPVHPSADGHRSQSSSPRYFPSSRTEFMLRPGRVRPMM